MSPDLQQNLFFTIYLLFSHNFEALTYFVGLIFGIILAIYRPSRFSTFVLLAFATLLFSFEYDKHIIVGLREQTIQSLIITQPHFKAQRIINLLISDILPILFYVTGWGFLFTALLLGLPNTAHKHHGKK